MPLADPSPAQASDVEQLADMLRPAVLRLSRRLRQETLGDEISMQEAVLLQRVRKTPGVGVSALADMEQTSRPTVSEQMKRLEAAGLVHRQDHAEDGRRSGFTLTPAGARKLEVIRARRTDWLARRLARLSEPERLELAAAVEPLLKLADTST